MLLIRVATCNLNQWALDYESNTNRIIESIHVAKRQGARLRVGPELEITGYSALDSYFEVDTFSHSWNCLGRILQDESLHDIIIDVGMPVIHRNVRYNCRILILNGKILFIRPKTVLAADGNYRENRYFTPWTSHKLETFHLPLDLQESQGTLTVPIGEALLSLKDTTLGCETCQELFEVNAPHSSMSLNGCEIFTNSSGSEWNLRKLDLRLSLIMEATRKAGGVYLYANSRGCDGERTYFDGSCMIILNGKVIAQGSQFALSDVEVVSATIDLDEVRAFRCTPSRGMQATLAPHYERLEVDFKLSGASNMVTKHSPTKPISARYYLPEEEIALGPACYLWDYLRRSGASGFLLPLSGGIDSCATATIVHSMCRMVIEAIKDGDEQVIKDVKRLNRHSKELPKTPQELSNIIFCTIYMGMKTQSSKETQSRAFELAKAIGSFHQEVWIDDCFSAFKNIFTNATGYEPKFTVHGGNNASNLALQNIQARSRMVCAYEFAQLIPTSRWGDNVPGMLVLGSANVDECLRGYLTKYDCSSADINPIGSISKTDLKRLIKWAIDAFEIPVLGEFLDATPTAELEPITKEYVQSDEAQMGMTYDELSTFGILRKEQKLGPLGMFQRLANEWKEERGLKPRQVAEKVKRFYHYYAINRHKMTTMTPGIHAETYSPDDNRYDHRPFLLPPMYKSLDFKLIDQEVEKLEKATE